MADKNSMEKYDEDIKNGNGDWHTWSKYVLKELDRMGKFSERTEKKLEELTILFTRETATMRTRVALISAAIAFGLSFVCQIIVFFLTKGK